MRTLRVFNMSMSLAAATLVSVSGCGVLGPSCLDQEKSGPVTTLTGRVEPGQIVSHVVPYDTRGSQNDAHISFSGQGTLTGPRLMVYATLESCDDGDFVPPTAQDTGEGHGDCAPIARPGGYLGPDGAIVPTQFTLTGPGNGGSGNPYKIFIVGDPNQAASYSISVIWVHAVDC
jgi:hypothetical protein